jgi:protein-histidine pros-kinase
MTESKPSNQEILREISELQNHILYLSTQLNHDDLIETSDTEQSEVTDVIAHLNEWQLKHLVDTASIGILIVNDNGIILFANEVISYLFQYSKDELLNRPLEQLIPISFREDHAQYIKRFFENAVPRPMGAGLELQALRSDGVQFPVEISLNVLQSSAGILTVAFIADMSELKEYQLNFKTIIDRAVIGILVVNNEGLITLANPITSQMFQYTRKELTGMTVNQLVPEKFREGYAKYIDQYFANPQDRPMGAGLEFSAQKRDGTIFPVEISLTMIQSKNSAITVAFIADITERKQNEAKQSELTKKILTNIGHDLKTPMTAILTRLYLLNQALDGSLHQHTDIITKHIKRLDEIVESMLEIAGLETVREIELVPSNLNQLVIEVIETNRVIAQNKAIELSYDLDTSLPDTKLNLDLMFVALQNLVRNAIIYTSHESRAYITTANRTNQIIISVTDTGIGIEEDKLPFIFDPFYRGDEARQINDSLNGLGLAIVKRIVELHHGRIAVESTLGEGSTFTIFLPKYK